MYKDFTSSTFRPVTRGGQLGNCPPYENISWLRPWPHHRCRNTLSNAIYDAHGWL